MVNVPFRGDLAGWAERSLSYFDANRRTECVDCDLARESVGLRSIVARGWVVSLQRPVYRRGHCTAEIRVLGRVLGRLQGSYLWQRR